MSHHVTCLRVLSQPGPNLLVDIFVISVQCLNSMRISDWTLKTTLYTWHGKKIFQERSKEQIDEAGRQKGLCTRINAAQRSFCQTIIEFVANFQTARYCTRQKANIMKAGVKSKKLYYVRNKGLSMTVPRYMYYAICSSRKRSWERGGAKFFLSCWKSIHLFRLALL